MAAVNPRRPGARSEGGTALPPARKRPEPPPRPPLLPALLSVGVVVALQVLVLLFWLGVDDHPIIGAEAETMRVARAYHQIIVSDVSGNPLTLAGTLLALDTSAQPAGPTATDAPVPPLAPMLGAWFSTRFGYSADHIAFANVFGLALLLVGLYAFAAQWLGPQRAVLAVALASFVPALQASARLFTPDLLYAAFVVCTLAALLAARGGQHIVWSLVAGACAGLAMLARPDAYLWLVVPTAVAAVVGLVGVLTDRSSPVFDWGQSGKILVSALLFLAAAGALAGPWYLQHPGMLGRGPVLDPAAPLSAELRDAVQNSGVEVLQGQSPVVPSSAGAALATASTGFVEARTALLEGLFALPALLAVLGLLAALLARGQWPALGLLYAWVFGGLALAVSAGRADFAALLPVFPALGLLLAAPVVALPARGARMAAGAVVGLVLLAQWGNYTIAPYGAVANIALKPPAVTDAMDDWLPLEIAVLRPQLLLHVTSYPVGAPYSGNPHARLMAAIADDLRRNYQGQALPANIAANMYGEDVAFELDQIQPPPNPWRPADRSDGTLAPRPVVVATANLYLSQFAAAAARYDYLIFVSPAVPPIVADRTQAELLAVGNEVLTRFEAPDRYAQPSLWIATARRGNAAAAASTPIAEQDIFTLYDLLYGPGATAMAAERRAEAELRYGALLRDQASPQAMSPLVTFLVADLQRAGSGFYRLRAILRVNEPMENDWNLLVRGSVADADLGRLSEVDRVRGGTDWSAEITPPTSQWKPGNDVLIAITIAAEPIPYSLSVDLFHPELGYHGRSVHLGTVDFGAL